MRQSLWIASPIAVLWVPLMALQLSIDQRAAAQNAPPPETESPPGVESPSEEESPAEIDSPESQSPPGAESPAESGAQPEPEPAPEAEDEPAAEGQDAVKPAPEAMDPSAERAASRGRMPEGSPSPEGPREPASAAAAAARPEPQGVQDDVPGFGTVAVVPAPAPGRSVGLRKATRNVQRLELEVFDDGHPLGVHDALDARLGSVVRNDVQNNPLQPDLQYRGFTASPLLGSPQGVAVYQNGTRLNEPFGDVVQWDLVPEFAIRELQVIPGASPLYGLNALGGSLALRTKDGFRNPGYRVTLLGGSFARHQVSVEAGGAVLDNWAAFGGVSSFGEHGFRDESPSRALHGFADLRHRTPQHELGVNLTLARTNLNGNAVAPVELFEREGRDAVFTHPDNTQNDLVMVAADLDRELNEALSVQAAAYVRSLRRDTLNGDEAEFEICDEGMQTFVCDEDGEFPVSEAGERIASTTEHDGLFNTTRTRSTGYGASLQLTYHDRFTWGDNELVAGARYDGGQVEFLQRAELGVLTRDRSVIGQNRFLGDAQFRTNLAARNRMLGVYATDTFSPVQALAINLSAGVNWVNVKLDDREGSALDGDHTFPRINPALGVAYSPWEALTLFASYSEANRAPSAAELACADPEQPCRLPNAFVADPPLEQVVTRAAELGVRGHAGEETDPILTWSVAGFGSRNFDDIIFVAGSRVGTGYFRNAGDTQRVGVEASLSGEAGPVRFYLGYQLLSATFQEDLSLPAPETEDDEEMQAGEDEQVEVQPGDRIPGLPRHSLKAGVALSPTPRLEVGLSSNGRTSSYFRGDEGNDMDPLDGHVIFSAHASYDVLDALQLFIKAQNLLDTEYETFGLLANPAEVLPGTSDPRFVSPGPPFAVWAGVVVHD